MFIWKPWNLFSGIDLTSYVTESMAVIRLKWSNQNSFDTFKIFDNISKPICVILIKDYRLYLKILCFLFISLFNLLEFHLRHTNNSVLFWRLYFDYTFMLWTWRFFVILCVKFTEWLNIVCWLYCQMTL